MSAFVGKWKLSGSENMDEFMQVMNVSWMIRKAIGSASPTQEWTVNGDHFHIKTITPFKTNEQDFTIGVEFEETQLDGSKMKTVVTKESEFKLVHHSKGEDKEVRVTKEIINDELINTYETLNMKKTVKAVRKYKRE